MVRRRARRLQRRWRLRALAARRPRPGRGRGVLPGPVRPGAGAAVPGGRAVLDPRVRAARRYGGAAAGRDRDAARPGGADDDLLRAGQHLGPAGGRPRGDARRRAARGCAPAARPRLPRRVRHRRRAHRRRVPAHRAQHPDVGRRHGAERGGPAVLHVPAGGARGRHGHRGSPRRTSRRWCRRWMPRRVGKVVAFGERRAGGARGELPGHLGRSGVRPHRGGDRKPVLDRRPPRAGCTPGWSRAPRWCRASGWRRSTLRCCGSSTRRTAPRSGRWSPLPTFVR